MKKKEKLVSIIVNCHNGERYLKKSIKSILSQTYKNWELIFWDNLSTDNSKKILKEFSDKRIKYFKSNFFLKLYEARNQAIEKSAGKYICFLDVDDYWVKNKIDKQIKFLEKNNEFKIVYSNFYTLKNKKKYIQFNHSLPTGKITNELLKKYCIGIVTVCLHKEVFKKKSFQKKYNIIGDFDFFTNISLKAKIGCIQEPLAYYRIHSQNYSNLKLEEYIKELSQWINKNQTYFLSFGYSLFHQKKSLLKLKVKFFLQQIGRIVQW